MNCFCFRQPLSPEEKQQQAFENAERKRVKQLAKEEALRISLHNTIAKDVLNAYCKGWYAYYFYDSRLHHYSLPWIQNAVAIPLQEYGIAYDTVRIYEHTSESFSPNIYIRFEKNSMQTIVYGKPEEVRSSVTQKRFLALQKQNLSKHKQKMDKKVKSRIQAKLKTVEKKYIKGQHCQRIYLNAYDFYTAEIIRDLWMTQMNDHKVFSNMTITCQCHEGMWGTFILSISIDPNNNI